MPDHIQPQGVFHPIRNYPNKSLPCSVSSSKSLSITQEIHYHDYYQIYYVNKGSLIHHVSGHYIRLMRGDCFIVPPYMAHKIEINPTSSSFYSFSFFESFLPEYIKEQQNIKKLFSVLTPTGILGRLVLSSGELIRVDELMRFAMEEFTASEPGYDCVLQGILASILILLSRTYEREEPEFKHNAAILACMEYINQHFSEKLTTKDIAGQLYFSEATFYRTFKRMTGHSFKEYLTMIRIRHACTLLRDKSEPIFVIAAKCGYGNYSAFYRAFLQEMQVSPIEYRQSLSETTNIKACCSRQFCNRLLLILPA